MDLSVWLTGVKGIIFLLGMKYFFRLLRGLMGYSMQVKLCENISKNELGKMKKMIGEAFVTNELFHEFGDLNTRRELV